MDWVKDYENIHKKMQQKCDKEMPRKIDLFFYYIENCDVKKIKKQSFDCTGAAQITAGELLYIIHQNKIPSYCLDEIMMYEAGTRAENMCAGELKNIPITINDIELKPSIFVFHDVNSIFFFFRRRQRPPRAAGETATHNKTYFRRRGGGGKRRGGGTRRCISEEIFSPVEIVENMFIGGGWESTKSVSGLPRSKVDEVFMQALVNLTAKYGDIDVKEYNRMCTHIKTIL
jgi:hypothetical protein